MGNHFVTNAKKELSMKDYRSFERININDWEDDKEWLDNRLDFFK